MIDGTVLAYIPSPSQGVWHIGDVPIRAYALCIIVGIVVAVWWGSRRWQARGGQPGEVIDVALWAVPFGLIGGRLYHVLTDWEVYFGPNGKGIGGALRIWDGGLGIWGAVALGAVGAWIGARNMGIKLPPFGDALAPAILLAQAIGRVGNYFNQELFGRPTTLPWGLEIFDRTNASGAVSYKLIDGVSTGNVYAIVHPTFLYEAIWNVLIVIALVLIDRYFRIGHGRLFAMYVAGYCIGRFGVELMRDDFATHIFGIRINVFTSAIVFLGAALYVVLAPRGREKGLSMYWPHRAEELAEQGAVGYVPPQMSDDDLDREASDAAATGSTVVAPTSEFEDSDIENREIEDIEFDGNADDAAEPEFEVATSSEELFAADENVDDGVIEPDAEPESVTEPMDNAETGVVEDEELLATELADDEPEAVDAESDTDAGSDTETGSDTEIGSDTETGSDAETGTDAELEPEADAEPEAESVVETEPEPEAEPEPEVERDVEAELEPEADVEQEPEVEAEPELEPEPEVEQDVEAELEPEADVEPEPDVAVVAVDAEQAAEAETAEPPAEPTPEPVHRVIPGKEPSITDSISDRGYTIVPADDEELSGITIIEQNPGGSAGAIEIRRASDNVVDEPEDSGAEPDSDDSDEPEATHNGAPSGD
ncbi:MAG: prolipoprotein diacylglyceryl transferase [Gordonia sp. (in: high G+C Gram-positive bacteria)]|uniref:prolipoprotein diacylglyceryl transferase n=1 Tax=Gordonia sp. (in: high G+C Gram-positive bacteria) TaxID=84139 RepID=UPI003C76CAFA